MMPPSFVEGWENVRSYLSTVGIVYRDVDRLAKAWKRYGLPCNNKTRPYIFPGEAIEAFVRKTVGVNLKRWLEQREEDTDQRKPLSAWVSRHGKGIVTDSTVARSPLYFMGGMIGTRETLVRQDDGYVYATREIDEAESWDGSFWMGRVRTAGLFDMQQTTPRFIRHKHRLKRPIHSMIEGVYSALTFNDEGALRFVRIPGSFVDCANPTPCVFEVRCESRAKIVKYVSSLSRTIFWLYFSNRVPLKPVTLEPYDEMPSHEELIRLVLPEVN